MNKTLIVMVGLPKSGKSTWARSTEIPIVNPDSVRIALHGQRFAAQAEEFVWAITHVMVEALFLAGHETVIVDGCHGTRKRRKPWIDRYNGAVQFHLISTDKKECINRARSEGDELIVPVIERMATEWEPYNKDELAQ